MKKIVIMMLFVCLLLFGCDEVESLEKETIKNETTEKETAMFGLSDKELEAIGDILSQKIHGGPHTFDDVEKITCLGYDKKLDKDGKWVEDTSFIEYEVILKNGETQKISIRAWLLEE